MHTNIFKIITKKKNDKQVQDNPISNAKQAYKGKAWQRDTSKRELIFN